MFGIPGLGIDVVWPLICAFFALGMLYTLGKALYMIYDIYDTSNIESQSRPFNSVAMPTDVQTLHEQLEAQGFVPLEVAIVKAKSMPEAGYEWHYTNVESTIWVETIQVNLEMPAMAQYATMFDDDAMIVTRFPMGEVYSTPNFHAHFAAKDLDAAHQYHVQKVNQWTKRHGEPRLVMGSEDINACNAIYRKTHRHLDFGKFVWGHAAQAVVALIAAIILFYSAATSRLLYKSDSMAISSMVTSFIGIGLVTLSQNVAGIIIRLRLKASTPLDNRKMKPKKRADQ